MANNERLVLSLGAMTFGWDKSSTNLDLGASEQLVREFVKDGNREIDTALLYSEGESEKMIGAMLKDAGLASCVHVATKGNPMASHSLAAVMRGECAPKGGFTEAKLRAQMDESLQSLRLDKIPLYYLHMPDVGTSLETTLAALHTLHTEGKFDELGLSNFAAWEVAHAWHLCDKNGWVKPTVYQGMYNAVTRQLEVELIPVCHKLGIRLRVYNPLAGGMLTGKHNGLANKEAPQGRFHDNPMYQARFWRPSFFQAMDVVKEACDAHSIPMAHAAFRWLNHHSKLRTAHHDGIILGVSNAHHLADNLAACKGDALPPAVVQALDRAWDLVRADCPLYFRGNSGADLN